MALSTTDTTAASTAARAVMTKLGTGSGVDTVSLAQSLVDAETIPKKSLIEKSIAKGEARISGYAAMSLSLDGIRTAFKALDDPSDVNALQSTNSNTAALSITSTTNSVVGTHTVEVVNLARAERRVSAGFAKADTQLNAGQAFVLRLTTNGSTKGIQITAGNATPAGMVSAINSAKLGVTAQLVNTNDGSTNPYKIVLTGTEGAVNAFSMSTDNGTGTSEQQELTFGPASISGTITVAGLSVAITAGDSASAVAAKVKTAMEADASKNSITGRSYVVDGAGKLTVTFAPTDGDMAATTYTGVGATGVTFAVTTPREYIAGPEISSITQQQKLTFSDSVADPLDPLATADITVAGVTVSIVKGDTKDIIATKVKAALEQDAITNGKTGRVFEAGVDGSLTATYAASDGAMPDITFADTGATGTTASAVTIVRAFEERPAVSFATSMQSAVDATLKVDGLTIKRASNSITDAIAGLTLDLHATTATDTPATVSLSRDSTALKAKVQALVKSYNDAISDFAILTGPVNSKDPTDVYSGSLANDSTVQQMKYQLRSMFLDNSTTPGSNVKALRDLGVSVDKAGTMTLDETKFDKAITNNYSDVVTALTANKENKSEYGVMSRGIAGDAIKRISDMMKSTGTLATQTSSSQKKIDRYKADLTKLEARMTAMLARYTKTFAAMDTMVGNSVSTKSSLKSTFDAMNNTSNN